MSKQEPIDGPNFVIEPVIIDDEVAWRVLVLKTHDVMGTYNDVEAAAKEVLFLKFVTQPEEGGIWTKLKS